MPTEYKPADQEVLDVMQEVIDAHDRFRPLVEHEVRVEVLMAWSENGTPVKVHGSPAAACVKVVGAEERATGGPDLRIKVDAKRYGRLSPRSRRGVFAHELYHAEVQLGDAGRAKRDAYGRPVVKLIDDDWCINGFREVAEWYGEHAAEVINYRRVGEVLAQQSFGFKKAPEPDAAAEKPPDVDAELTAGVAEVEAARAAKNPTDGSVIKEAFAVMLSLGHTQQRAREMIDMALGTGRKFSSRVELIEAVYLANPDFKRGEAEGEAWHKARHAEDWRSLPLSDLRGHGMGAATITALWEAKVDALGPLFDLADAGDLDTLDLSDDQVDEVLAAKRSFLKGPAAAPWRELSVASLDVPGAVSGLLLGADVKTLGDLADQLDEGGYSDLGLSRKWKTTVKEVVEIRYALEAIRNAGAPKPAQEHGPAADSTGRQIRPGEHPLPERLASPAGPQLDRDVWLLLSSDRVRWEHDSFYTNPVLKLPENVDEDLLKRADAVIGRIGGEWAEDVKGYTFALVRCPDALAAVVKAKRAPTVWQDAPLSGLLPPHAAKALAEQCGVHTAGQLDARIKTLHDQDVVAKAAGIDPDMMAEYVVALEDWIKSDGRPAKGADPAKVSEALKRVEAIGRKPRVAKAEDAPKPPAEDGLFLVFSGKGKTPVYCTPAASLLDAIYFVKSQHPADARMTVKPDDGTAKRLGLPVVRRDDPSLVRGKSWEDSKRHVEECEAAGVCPVCKGAPKTMCPACARVAPAPPEPEKKPRRRRKPAGPAEARP